MAATRSMVRPTAVNMSFFALKLFLYLTCCSYSAAYGFWQGLHMWRDFTCKHPPLPPNQSGIRLIVAGFAKMGTRTVSRSLFELGYEQSYHGEELLLHVWHPITVDFWARPENGGLVVPPIGHRSIPSIADLLVLSRTSSETLARETSRCHVDAVAFDGTEVLFWPVFRVSPSAKVLVLNWRTYEEARRSFENFAWRFDMIMEALGLLHFGGSALPWAALFYLTEKLFGNPVEGMLKRGGPPFNQVMSPIVMLWLRQVAPLRLLGHYAMGLNEWVHMDKERYDRFFADIERFVPQELRMNFDPRKTTYEDLCRFLEMKECRRSGRLPRAPNLFNSERDFLPAFLICTPIWLLIHWANWRFFHWLLRLLWLTVWWVLRRLPLTPYRKAA